MSKIVGVSFKTNGKIYFFDSKDLQLQEGQNVIVETEKGKQFGKVEVTNVELVDNNEEIKSVLRIASESDERKNKKNIEEAQEAIESAKKIAEDLDLNMKFTDATFNFDRSQLILYFVSETRIDFRNLAKELASIYKTRIELRQIGVRDKAREVSGLGQCGRQLCCASFLNDLDSVSISMAKNQNLALNPSKINGQCGRLLCCLKYEDEVYTYERKNMPTVGKRIDTKFGEGKVISADILNHTYKVELDNGDIEEIKVPEEESGSEQEDEGRKSSN